mgnify:CR=1 FL=1
MTPRRTAGAADDAIPPVVPRGCVLVSVPKGDMRNEGGARRFCTAVLYAEMLRLRGAAEVLIGDTCMLVAVRAELQGDCRRFEAEAASRVNTVKATDVEEALRRAPMLEEAASACPDAVGWSCLTGLLDGMRLKYDIWR